MPRILAAVDGSEEAAGLPERIVDCYGGSIATYVAVRTAEPRPIEWQTRGVAREAIDDGRRELGHKAATAVAEQLEQARIPAKTRLATRLELGEPADTIIRCAKEEGCDLIVMSDRPPGAGGTANVRSTDLAWGSVAAQVVKLSDIPVVVLK